MNQHPDEALAARRRKDRPDDLNPRQLDWCRRAMPGFKKAHDDVLRRDCDVAANRVMFAEVETVEPVNIVTLSRGTRGA